jgi:hypothetical protein
MKRPRIEPPGLVQVPVPHFAAIGASLRQIAMAYVVFPGEGCLRRLGIKIRLCLEDGRLR